MKMLLTVITVSLLCTNRLVVADDQCTQHQFKSPFYPGSSCEDIYNKNPESREISGYYWITDGLRNIYCGMSYTGLSCEDIYYNNPETDNNSGYYRVNSNMWTFCNMTAIAASCTGVEGQWRRIACIDISAGDKCPTGWNRSSHNGVSFCRTPSDDGGCYSTFFSTNGVSYQHVCGRARGYQKSTPNGFRRNTLSIDTYYVDGLSITHGNPRQHIWTYAVGLTDNGNYPTYNCPCAVIPGQAPPSFVGNNYYCESGAGATYSYSAYYLSDPLWDGAGCSASNTCCFNTNQPWFHHQLSSITQDDIEVRICTGHGFSDEAILVDLLEFYIQ